MQFEKNDDLFEEQHESLSLVPVCLAMFDVEVVALNPLRMYVFTSTPQKWQAARDAFQMLEGLISPESFIELDEKGKLLQGVYARDLAHIIYGNAVEMIEEAAYRLQNDV